MIVNKELAISSGHLSKDLWETPYKLFSKLNDEFNFTLDPCCMPETAKCPKHYTPLEDGLKQSWANETVFVNPPYSRGNIDKWVEKCYRESIAYGPDNYPVIVALLPVSTSAKWFHKWVWKKADLRFIQGRIRFVGAPYTAPFSSMLAIYRLYLD